MATKLLWLGEECVPEQSVPDSQGVLGVVALRQCVHAAVLQVFRDTQRPVRNPLRGPGQQNRDRLQTAAGGLSGMRPSRNVTACNQSL